MHTESLVNKGKALPQENHAKQMALPRALFKIQTKADKTPLQGFDKGLSDRGVPTHC